MGVLTVEQLMLLSELTRDFAEATSEYARLLTTVCSTIGRLSACFCALAIVSEDEKALESAGTFDDDARALAVLGELFSAATTPLDADSIAARTLDAGKQLVLHAAEAERALRSLRPTASADVAQLGVKSLLLCPLHVRGKGLGILSLVRHGSTATSFGEADLHLARELAAHAALAISNARVFAEAGRMAARLGIIADASRDFSEQAGDHGELLLRIVRRLSEVIGDMCALQFVREDGEGLEPVCAVYHPDPELLDAQRAVMRLAPLRMGEGVSGRVAATGRSILLPQVSTADLLQSMAPERRELMARLDITSVMAAPLIARGRTIGVLAMSRNGPGRPYRSAELRLLEDLAAHAALAITNSQLLLAAQRELSERKEAEAALARTEEQLRHAQKLEALGRLAGGVAHDFNNLLSVILSYCSLVDGQLAPTDPARGDLAEIEKAGERAAQLTRQLLGFSRRQISEPQNVSVNATLAGLDGMLHRLVGADIEMKVVLADGLGKVRVDPGHLEQIIMNLVVNARDAMPHGGKLTLSTASIDLDESFAREHLGVSPGPHVLLAVSDDGSGMDRATQDRIFEPFFTTKESGRGTGLGLSIVFGIVKQCGGTIWVYSEVGRGTTFKIYLPVSTTSDSRSRPASKVATLSGTETLLLAEDEPQLREVVKGVLERNGYRVLLARDGQEALEICRHHEGPIDLLLTDVIMPRLSGAELAGECRLVRPSLQVLFMSGYTDDALAHRSLLGASFRLLGKPFTPDILLRKVRETLEAATDTRHA